MVKEINKLWVFIHKNDDGVDEIMVFQNMDTGANLPMILSDYNLVKHVKPIADKMSVEHKKFYEIKEFVLKT